MLHVCVPLLCVCSERHGPLVERMKSVMEKELEVIVREERWADCVVLDDAWCVCACTCVYVRTYVHTYW